MGTKGHWETLLSKYHSTEPLKKQCEFFYEKNAPSPIERKKSAVKRNLWAEKEGRGEKNGVFFGFCREKPPL